MGAAASALPSPQQQHSTDGAGNEGLVAPSAASFANRLPDDVITKLLPLPPIHVHHNVIAVGSGGVHAGVEVAMVFDCLLRGESCLDASGMVCHLGDYQCLSDGGGTDCFAREYG